MTGKWKNIQFYFQLDKKGEKQNEKCQVNKSRGNTTLQRWGFTEKKEECCGEKIKIILLINQRDDREENKMRIIRWIDMKKNICAPQIYGKGREKWVITKGNECNLKGIVC